MITSLADIFGYLVVGIMLYAFGFGAYGYSLLLHQALHSSDRQAALKRVLHWQGNEHLMDSRGLFYIYRCAKIGAVVFSLLLVWLMVILTR